MTTEIDLIKLKAIVNRMLDHAIETRGISSVPLHRDLYWDVQQDQRYEMDKNTSEHLEVGSLKDDWELISAPLAADETPVMYQLTEVAPLLRYIGEALSEQLAKYGG